MQHDKKNTNGKLSFALIEKRGHPIINIISGTSEIKEAFVLYNNLLK